MKYFLSLTKAAFLLMVWISAGFFSLMYAAGPTSFDVVLDPSSLVVWEPADMTVKAIDENWETVKDFQGPILISFEWFQDIDAYDVPDGGYYEFVAEDQWSKRFSKGLVMKKSGEYVLRVEIPWEDVVGSVRVSVKALGNQNESSSSQQSIQLQEPLPWSELKGSSVNVIWLSDSRQTPLEFELNGKILQQTGQTDDSGIFSIYLAGLKEGEQSLVVRLLNFQWDVIGESDEISFRYFPPETDDFLISFDSDWSGVIDFGRILSFEARTDTTVKSVKLDVVALSWDLAKSFVMDREEAWFFKKSINFSEEGDFVINIVLVFDGGQEKEYPDRATIQVKAPKDPKTSSWSILEASWIKQLKVTNDAADPSRVEISWTTFWNPHSFLVRYGVSEDDLSQEARVKEKQIKVSWLSIGKKYFFQIVPLNDAWEVVGEASDIATIMTQWKPEEDGTSWPSCVVVGIDITTKKIGDDYYLVRDKVANAVSYSIYSADKETKSISDMKKIATVTTPQFKYPFDVDAEEDEYTYYAVVAQCDDGTELQLDSVKKIHTWPASDLLLFLVIASLSYMLFRIYRYRY